MRNLGVRIAAAVAFTALLAGFVACGKNGGSSSTTSPTPTPTPAPTNHAPTITNITMSPTFGVSTLTVISMSASATDADNDTLTYTWSFAGKTMTGASIASTMTGDGAVTVNLTVSDGKGGTVNDSRSITIGNMTGRWTFVFVAVCNPTAPTVLPIMTLTQLEGGIVTGDLVSPASWCNVPAGQTGFFDPAAPGKIDGTGAFTGARLKIGAYTDTFLTGQMDGTGRVITGTTKQQTTGSTDTFRMVKQ
jgi:hypothetical protein